MLRHAALFKKIYILIPIQPMIMNWIYMLRVGNIAKRSKGHHQPQGNVTDIGVLGLLWPK
jgi:hypothetical protein